MRKKKNSEAPVEAAETAEKAPATTKRTTKAKASETTSATEKPAPKSRTKKSEEAPLPEPEPKTSRAKKATDATVASDPAPAPKRQRKSADEPAADATTPSEQPKRGSRSKKAESIQPATDTLAASEIKPSKPARSRSKTKADAPSTDSDFQTDEVQLIFRKPIARGPADHANKPTQNQERRKGTQPKSLAELVEEEKNAPKPKGRRPKQQPSEEPSAPPAVVEPRAESRQGRERRNDRREKRASGKQPSSSEAKSLDGLETQEFEDLIVFWRAADAPSAAAQAAISDDQPLAEKKSRRRGRSGRQDREPKPDLELEATFRPRGGKAAPKEQARPPEPEPLPARPTRPAIQIPVDAPQVIMRGGIPTLVRNTRVYPPIAFFGHAPDERRAQTVLSEIRRASEAGIHIHSHLVEFTIDPASVDDSVSLAAYLLAETLKVDQDAQVVFRLLFIPPKGWEGRFPNARYLTEQGRLADPSLCDEDLWSVARECLAEFVKKLRLLDLNAHILGVHLDRGEWFFPEGTGYDTSRAATEGFRDWLRTKYVNDLVALRAAWFDGSVDFKSIQVPQFNPSGKKEGGQFMRISRKERRWVDYHLFLSDSTVARISDLAYAAKEASEGYFLVGVSYGYTFEWSHPASAHLGLGKLLRTPEIDFIAGPPSYRNREAGGAAPFPCPIDSLPLNGKLYLSEDDFKTAIGEHREPDDYNPVIKTPQALEAVHWRGIGAALAHGTGAIWMDLWGNGWLNTSTIWDRGGKAKNELIKRMAAEQSDPDVAVFIDERALAYLVDEQSFALLVQNVRESVFRSGLSAGFYLLSDLAYRETFPECKLYVFLNAWDIRPEHRLAIKNRLQRDNKVLFWLYCAGMFDNGREQLERAREITGIAIKPQPFHSKTGTTIVNRRHPLSEAFQGQGLIGGVASDPSYFAIPENAVVLGEYSSSGLPSFVVRNFNEDPDPSKHWKSVFLGEPVVTPALMRALAQLAGAHIWNYQDDVVHVRPPFVTVHCTGSGQRTITLPKNWHAYNLLKGQWETEESNHIRFHGMDGSTHMFLAETREEIDRILGANPADLLHIEELPEKAENSVRLDSLMFDVPIMRLDEFIEDGVPEEVSEDWFLKPSMIESDEPAEPEQDEKIGRRRRRRGGRRGRDDDRQQQATATSFDEDLGMSVMFRKRD
jgi:hypothetical protein